MKVAEIIIHKLDGIHAKLDDLTTRVAKLEQENFLLEEYKPDHTIAKPKGPFVPVQTSIESVTAGKIVAPKGPMQFEMFDKPKTKKKRGKYRKQSDIQLPPSIARKLMDDNELAQSTKNSYAGILDRILKDPINFEKVIRMRNDGITSKNIAAHLETLHVNSVFTSFRTINNSITVARRYGLTELKDKKYVITDLFHQSKRG